MEVNLKDVHWCSLLITLYGSIFLTTMPLKSASGNESLTCNAIDKSELSIWYYYDWPSGAQVCSCQYQCPSQCMCILEDHKMTTNCPEESPTLQIIYEMADAIGISWSDTGLNGIGENAFSVLLGLEESRLLLSRNRISQIHPDAFKDLSNLTSLDLESNDITELHYELFKGLVSLQWLLLNANKITQLHPHGFKDLSSLRYLFLATNDIEELPPLRFEGLYSLWLLILSDNNIANLTLECFKGPDYLVTLTLTDNNLDSLQPQQFADLPYLYHLDLGSNNISQIEPEHFDGLAWLRELILDNNNIAETSGINGLSSLHLLRLKSNRISMLQKKQFEGVSSLSSLHLSDNNINNMHFQSFQGLIFLTSLFLDNNNIIKLHVNLFDGLVNLNTLNLESNRLVRIEPWQFKGLGSITHMYLAQNEIETLSPHCFGNLTYLSYLGLGSNNVQYTPHYLFVGHNNLWHINLANNALLELPPDLFGEESPLLTFILRNNHIQTLHSKVFEKLQFLRHLDLNNNNLAKLSPTVFLMNRMLSSLFLSKNRISSLPGGIFQNLYNLEILDLSENVINQLNSRHIFKNSTEHFKLTYFDLRKNTLYSVNNNSFQGFGLENQSTEILVDNEATCCFIHTASCNATIPRSQFLTCGRLLPNQIQRVTMWILSIFAIISNLAVLIFRLSRKQESNKVQTMFISNLSLSDLFMGIYMVIIVVADLFYRDYFPSEAWRASITCKVAGTLSVLSSEASVFFITLISIDRLMGIKYTFSKFRIGTKSARRLGLIVWVFSFTLAVISTIISGINPDVYDVSEVCTGLPLSRSNIFENWYTPYELGIVINEGDSTFNITLQRVVDSKPGMYYGIAVFLVLNALSFLVVIFCYCVIFVTVIQTAKKAGRSTTQKEELKMAIKMGVIVMTDVACWMPIIILSILVQSGRQVVTPDVYTWIVTFVLPINSAINPFLYTLAAVIYDTVQKPDSFFVQ